MAAIIPRADLDWILQVTFSGRGTERLPDEVAARIHLRADRDSGLLWGLKKADTYSRASRRAWRVRRANPP
jgi:hypothetical protein